jgi:hypothetical protein
LQIHTLQTQLNNFKKEPEIFEILDKYDFVPTELQAKLKKEKAEDKTLRNGISLKALQKNLIDNYKNV